MNRRELETILENWDVGDLVSFRQATMGLVNVNWVVKTTKGRYILKRVSQSAEAGALEFEMNYLTFLKEHKFPYEIPVPLRTGSREFVARIEGFRFWMYEYVEGRSIKRFSYPELRECAKMMATYHTIIESSGLDNGKGCDDVFRERSVSEEMEQFRAQILRENKRDTKERIFLKESSTLIPLMRNLDTRKYSRLPRYPLHRDINPENTLWKKGKLVGLIDFENTGTLNDTLVKDISVMLQYSCRDKKQKHKTDLKLASFFLREYRKHHTLLGEEISFIPDIITAGAIEDFSYAYWMLVNDPKRAKLYRLHLYSQVAQWHHKNRTDIIKKLTNR
jgi:Ser/Thr protein kinase RdoA (MazF antagonist)